MTVTLANQIKIREAKAKDLDRLLEFEQAIIEFERQFDPTLKPGKIHYYDLAGMLHAKQVSLQVATFQEQIIGSGFAHIMSAEMYLQHKKQAYLGFMYVVPQWRRKGVNQLILQSLLDWIQAKGIDEIRLDVYEKNSAAINAYKKMGFSNNLLEMRMSLKQKNCNSI